MPSSEAAVQAVSGLMEAHGRQHGVPERLGLDVASVCAGVVAAQAALAARLATLRGMRVSRVETSVVEASLLLLAHHITYATCGDDWCLPADGDGAGPPFATLDGSWVEIEALTTESWHEFWTRVGAVDVNLDTSSLLFALRYTTARCHLPAELNNALARLTLEEVTTIADQSGIALRRLRSVEDVTADASLPRVPWSFRRGVGHSHGARAPRSAPTIDAPLAGIRVVEATSRLQGPLAGLLLRMLGADVIKVEPPGGDPGRIAPPRAGDDGAFYVTYNHDKQPVELDLNSASGRETLAELIASADVFLHNWRSSRADQLGLDADTLLARHPSLVWAHASGWGSAASSSADVATEYLVQAHTACGAALHPVDEPPFPTLLTIVDTMGGLIACEAILAALVQRELGGSGCRVETSLLSAAMTLQQEGSRTTPRGARPSWHAFDRPLAAADGWILVSATDGDSMDRALAVCGLPGRAAIAADARPRIADRVQGTTADEWITRFAARDVSAVRVCTDLATLETSGHTASLLRRGPGGCAVPAAPWHFTA
ncbi:MAG TPA: CoA transferase [Candidatus Dormibacteraeota bacterium]